MGITNRVAWENVRTLAFGAISGTYAALGTAIANPARIIKLVNTTDVTITVSTDGTNDKDVLPSGTFILYDFTSNRDHVESAVFTVRQGTTFYVKGTPASGSVYLIVIYAVNA